MRDQRTAQQWYDSVLPEYRRPLMVPRGLVIAVAMALFLGAGFAVARVWGFDPTTSSRDFVNNLLDDVLDLPPLPPEEPLPTPGPGPNAPEAPGGPYPEWDPGANAARYQQAAQSHPELAEGQDYAFISKVDGLPVRWSCAHQIPVVLAGDVPAGTEDSFLEVVAALREVSGLPLEAVIDADGHEGTNGEVVVWYIPFGSQAGRIRLDGDDTLLGRGGPSYYASGEFAGRIGAGEVAIRNDVPGYEPTTGLGKTVLAHELMHALGLHHAAEDEQEIMAPYAHEFWPEIGAGDRVGLQVVGCGAL